MFHLFLHHFLSGLFRSFDSLIILYDLFDFYETDTSAKCISNIWHFLLTTLQFSIAIIFNEIKHPINYINALVPLSTPPPPLPLLLVENVICALQLVYFRFYRNQEKKRERASERDRKREIIL